MLFVNILSTLAEFDMVVVNTTETFMVLGTARQLVDHDSKKALEAIFRQLARDIYRLCRVRITIVPCKMQDLDVIDNLELYLVST
jgi:hypothetical protein